MPTSIKHIFIAAILLPSCMLTLSCFENSKAIITEKKVHQTDSSKANPDNLELHFLLGTDSIRFLIRNPTDSKGVIYFNMHDNENTAVAAADSIVSQHGGRFIELKHKGKRWLEIKTIDKTSFCFDPNRIFTDLGIYKTLRTCLSYSSQNQKLVKNFSQFITDSLLSEPKIIIAIHNNVNGYSINEYLEKGLYRHNADKTFFNKDLSPHDFYLVNDSIHFDYFQQLNYNVVLLSKNADDDGSLSVYCQQKNISYINVEAKEGHFQEQYKMLELVQELIKR